MKELQIFNYGENEVRTMMKDGEPWFALKDVCDVLGLSDTNKVAERLDADELTRIKFVSGGQTREMYAVNESGLYNVILRSDKPEAKIFKRWITHEVLPSIRKTGEYKTKHKEMTDYQSRTIKTREENVKIRKAQILKQIAEGYEGTYRQVLEAHATYELKGEFILPLPELGQKTFSATDLGEMFGITANMIGKIANTYGLKTENNGAWFNDKAKGHNKEVQTFRYFENAIPEFKKYIN